VRERERKRRKRRTGADKQRRQMVEGAMGAPRTPGGRGTERERERERAVSVRTAG
jgi:hypothetical protein